MIGVVLAGSLQLDRGEFMPSAQMVTGMNHVYEVDNKPGISTIVDDMRILNNFSGKKVDLSPSVMYIAFMFAGMYHDIAEIVEYCGGMSHMHTALSLRPDLKCVFVVGSVAQWRSAVKQGCTAHEMSTAREAFNKVHVLLKQNGVGDNLKEVDQKDGTFLLEHK